MSEDINSPNHTLDKRYIQQGLPGLSSKGQTSTLDISCDPYMRKQLKRVIEALLFSSNEPVSLQRIRDVTDTLCPSKPREIKEILIELQHEYLSQARSFRLEEIGEGFLLRTCEEYSPYIDLLLRNRRSEKLSQASAEVLAIITYKQPITRPQIDAIRGVDSSGSVQNLLERELIEAVGKLEVAGRPTLYATTRSFLKHFGLKDLKELPSL